MFRAPDEFSYDSYDSYEEFMNYEEPQNQYMDHCQINSTFISPPKPGRLGNSNTMIRPAKPSNQFHRSSNPYALPYNPPTDFAQPKRSVFPVPSNQSQMKKNQFSNPMSTNQFSNPIKSSNHFQSQSLISNQYVRQAKPTNQFNVPAKPVSRVPRSYPNNQFEDTSKSMNDGARPKSMFNKPQFHQPRHQSGAVKSQAGPMRAQGQRNRVPGPYTRPNTKQQKLQNNAASRPQWNNKPVSQVGKLGNRSAFPKQPVNEDIRCDICEISCQTRFIYNQHVHGTKHQKKVKRMEITKLWLELDPSVYCADCDKKMEPNMMEHHLVSFKHKSVVEGKLDESNEKGKESDKNGIDESTENKEESSKTDTDPPEPKSRKMEETGTKKTTEIADISNEIAANQSQKNSVSQLISVDCDSCSITLKSLPGVIRHFNSKGHALKCLAKFDVPSKSVKPVTAETIAANFGSKPTAIVSKAKKTNMTGPGKSQEGKLPEKGVFRCETCDLTLNGRTPFEAHLAGFKHNFKLTNGNFDSDSPHSARMLKMKERQEKRKQLVEKANEGEGMVEKANEGDGMDEKEPNKQLGSTKDNQN